MSAEAPNAAFEYVSEVYEAIDSMDEQRLALFLSENCTFVYANNDPVTGRENIAESSKSFMALIAGIRHQLLDVWAIDNVIVSRIDVTYTRKDGSTLTVPAVTVWRVRDGRIDDYRIYIDVAPLFAY
ncbi:nuclear transport factor 2 family protein [Paraburkholderia panacisoli]|jgi:ketosteroid isomerase-like protein|uniref:Nuclear transport factor 2 family protein n=1 Tax=Paraburkholderia panacisoli TaxID=2603818 RepID=A0A5B0HHQ5_9BURK|nr:nuclear transport factor 2 family protein [Paraburkholderia panacisoli]KAA1014393.1 nuclear transport factor 2 family protein [Paraburkholderia panacisoli]